MDAEEMEVVELNYNCLQQLHRLRKDSPETLLSGLLRAPWTGSLFNVQRLFSMFPMGIAGAALLILRFSVAASLVVDGTAHWPFVKPFWVLLSVVVPAAFLCLGFLTPYSSAVSCLFQLGVLLIARGQNELHLVLSILNSGTLAMLGPGAYSIDARIFGRRLLTVPPRR